MQQSFSFMNENKRAWLDDARHMARKLLANREYITSDDIWAFCPPPGYINGKIMGSVFTTPDFESVGFTRTKRASSHGRVIQKFRLKSAQV